MNNAPAVVGGVQALIDLLPDLTPNDRSLIERAYHTAETAHAGQMRKSGEPFFSHCVAVATILAELKLDAEAISAALLHDVVEDTDIPLETLRAEFGKSVALIVNGVSKLRNLPEVQLGDKRSKASVDRSYENIRKMALAMNDDVRVVLVKLADRLHNMRTLGYMPAEKQRRIAQETLDIYAPLANRLGIWQFKWELEDLAFRYLNPDKYREIARQVDERRADREGYLQQIMDTLRTEIEHAGVTGAIISARPKHIYSIYRKMERKDVAFEHVYDVRALRVIVDSVPHCYQVLGIVHNLWRPVPGEFDDYIAAPKENFYRSLHTAVRDNQGKTLEVQIRTMEMHEHAEYGIAAHWRYKEGRKGHQRDLAFEERINHIRRLMEFGGDTDDAAAFVQKMKAEVFQDRIYVFTPKGDIIDLANGATPIDFAYHVHTDIGHHCRGAKINGRLVNLTYTLKTGDQVDIVTQNRGGPSLDWLNPNLGYVRTERARAKIRHWFRKQNREKSIQQGREVLERELKRLGVLEKTSLEEIGAGFHFDRLEDFLAEVGAGGINGAQIGAHILERENAGEEEPDERSVLVERPTTIPKNGGSGISVLGAGGMLVTLARCCKPVPGDPIVGFITRGRGVMVHRQDCGNIVAEPERRIEVEWGKEDAQSQHAVDIEIVAYDRKGLMLDIATVVADEKINMTSVNVSTKQNIATFYLTIEIGSKEQLSRVLSRLETIKSVTEVHRRYTV
ncbi:MAG: bifunctional (p)ppGpp synthetase/guanosine-3',5'-bis(diphosphate) 3'-pyrophosphohydrolase [Anaerolineae bacterium]|nr:bifunctional (p)ppGpp synthetase/guanosine-3',5'-bis(diphosphate) 3'-pyrophosphohydrolase [Anaerolineae bacterium]NUQ03860.1 bifunctional (p)ppGpp synthetase/guanosine-3',5'-bis(diphosphate) 3'-pyrophosphohydrolase [Anaerolineae bacterium]